MIWFKSFIEISDISNTDVWFDYVTGQSIIFSVLRKFGFYTKYGYIYIERERERESQEIGL